MLKMMSGWVARAFGRRQSGWSEADRDDQQGDEGAAGAEVRLAHKVGWQRSALLRRMASSHTRIA